MKRSPAQFRSKRASAILILAISASIPVAAQTPDVLDWKGKLHFHAESTYGPWALLGFAAFAGALQVSNSPREWGQGAAAYGERFGSVAASSAIHSVLAFGLDSTLHEDPRYHRSDKTGFWRRSVHAFRGTLLTRTDSGGETVSAWRIGSAYGSAFLSNTWYPDRLNTPKLGFAQGTITLGFGLISNLGAEFWPEIRRKVLRKK